MNPGPYSASHVIGFIGKETPGYSAVVCRVGRPIAAAVDTGDGSNVQMVYFDDAEKHLLAEFIAGLPPEPFERLAEGIPVDEDFFVSHLVESQMQLGQCQPTFGARYKVAA